MRLSEIQAKARLGLMSCRNPGNRANGVAENMLLLQFSPTAPNRCWAADIIYIRSTDGWCYLAAWIGLHCCRVAGWAIRATIETTMVLEVLHRLFGGYHIAPDQLLIHPDRGETIPANGIPTDAGRLTDHLQPASQGLLP